MINHWGRPQEACLLTEELLAIDEYSSTEFSSGLWLQVGYSREEDEGNGPGAVEGQSGGRCDQNTQRTTGG